MGQIINGEFDWLVRADAIDNMLYFTFFEFCIIIGYCIHSRRVSEGLEWLARPY